MKGTMPDGNDKRECVMLSLGTAAYLSMRSGADISIICGDDWKSRLNHFERGGGYFEESMDLMQHALFKDTEKKVECPEVWEVIDMILDMPLRGVSICLVTDLFRKKRSEQLPPEESSMLLRSRTELLTEEIITMFYLIVLSRDFLAGVKNCQKRYGRNRKNIRLRYATS